MPAAPEPSRPPASRWTSFLADPAEDRPRILSEAQDAHARLDPGA